MDTLTAVLTLENGPNRFADEHAQVSEQVTALQTLINSGTWALQGTYGRSMMAAIEDGACMLGHTDARDYWGNHIPSRSQVQEGTKGSFDYVAERYGLDYAEALAEIGLNASNAG